MTSGSLWRIPGASICTLVPGANSTGPSSGFAVGDVVPGKTTVDGSPIQPCAPSPSSAPKNSSQPRVPAGYPSPAGHVIRSSACHRWSGVSSIVVEHVTVTGSSNGPPGPSSISAVCSPGVRGKQPAILLPCPRSSRSIRSIAVARASSRRDASSTGGRASKCSDFAISSAAPKLVDVRATEARADEPDRVEPLGVIDAPRADLVSGLGPGALGHDELGRHPIDFFGPAALLGRQVLERHVAERRSFAVPGLRVERLDRTDADLLGAPKLSAIRISPVAIGASTMHAKIASSTPL